MRCEPAWHHEMLLRAGLTRGEAALAAFRAWRARVDLHDVDGESVPLLPAVYRNLVAHGVDDPILPRLRGVYRKAWAEGQLRASSALAALDALRRAGVAAALARGAPLVAHHHGDAGICAPADADVVVASSEVLAATRALAPLGWTRVHARSAELRHVDGTGLILHGSMPGGSGELEATEVAMLGGASVTVLDPAGQLFFACGGHRSGHAVESIAWVLETMAVLRARGVDWERLVTLADVAGTAAVLEARLDYARRVLEAVVPDDALARLRDSALERERRDLAHAAAAARELSTLRGAWRRLWREFVSWATTSHAPRTPPAFLRYLRLRWRLGSSRQVPLAACARLARIARGAVRRSASAIIRPP